jgi:aryl-alcohol dehydrogenase-like predicted oxidoreductase
MIWGEASGAQRFMPAKSAYGGTNPADEQAAFDASLEAEINFFDTAAMYSAGGSERRLGELADGRDVVIATKFPPTPFGRVPDLHAALNASLTNLRRSTIDLYQHHFPSPFVKITELMRVMADAVEAGKIKAVGVSNYSAVEMRTAYQTLARWGIPLASNSDLDPTPDWDVPRGNVSPPRTCQVKQSHRKAHERTDDDGNEHREHGWHAEP